MRLPRPRDRRPPASAPKRLRAFGADLFQLAFFATGSDAQAATRAGRALAERHDERQALHALAAGLPYTVENWPESTIALSSAHSITPEAAARVLAVLGKLAPKERLALGLHLLMDVPLNQLRYWLGSSTPFEHIPQCLLEVGEALDLIPPVPDDEQCRAIGAHIVDIDDIERGRAARLHLLSSDCCVPRVEGVRRTRQLVREAIDDCFPRRSPGVVAPAGYSARSRRSAAARPIAGTCASVLLAAALLIFRPAAQGQQLVVEHVTAAGLIDRALHRLDPGLRQGVLHERYRAGTGADAILGERWIAYQAPQQMRLVLTRASDRALLLDLTTDGGTRLQYTAQIETTGTTTGQVSDRRVANLMPLLRQLPASGALGSFPPTAVPNDLLLVAAARRGTPTLLGTTTALGRRAYLLAYMEPGTARRIVLTLDAETAGVLKATASLSQSSGAAEALWQTETVDVLPSVPAHMFDLRDTDTHRALPDPRHLLVSPFSNLSLPDIAQKYVRFPSPAVLPAGTSIAYLRDAEYFGAIQVYEGDWASVIVITPLSEFPPRPGPPLANRIGNLVWGVVHVDPAHGLTTVACAPATEPLRRSLLYLWHAFQTDDERKAAAMQLLAQMRWLDTTQLAELQGRFVARPTADVAPVAR